MEPPPSGLRHQGLDAVHQQLGGRRLVPADVVEADVAEGALLPVTAVGHRQLVPMAVGPQSVHRIQRVENGEVPIERQSVVGRRADFAQAEIRLRGAIAPADTIPLPEECSLQSRAIPRSGQILQEAEQGPLPVVQRDEVDIVEDARVLQAPELRGGVAAAQSHADVRVRLLDELREAKGSVEIAGKGNRQSHERWAGLAETRRQGVAKNPIRQPHRLGQRRSQRVERTGRLGHLFRVAAQGEVRRHSRAEQVREVFQIESGEMLRELRGRRNPATGRRGSGREPGALRQEAPLADAMGERRVFSLEKGHHRLDRVDVGVGNGQHLRRFPGEARAVRADVVERFQEARPRE